MKTTLKLLAAGVCTVALVQASLPHVSYAAEAPVVTGKAAAVMSAPLQLLEQASSQLRGGRAAEALTTYKQVLNDPQEAVRATARLGTAYALSQLGDDAQALRVLEGTVSDDTPLGKALATVRANLLLQLTDKAVFMGEVDSGKRYLETYDRLTLQTDATRAERLRAALNAAEMPARAPLKVGVLLPFLGNLADVSENILMGLQLGLVTTPLSASAQVELLPVDTSAGVAEAVANARAAGAQMMVGPLLSKDVEAAKRALLDGADGGAPRIPLLSLSSDRAVGGEGIHALNYLPTDQATAAATWALAQKRLRLAALVPSTPYGYEVFDAYRQAVEKAGFTIAASSFYNPQNVDISAAVRQLVGTSGQILFDALFIPAPASSLSLIFSQLAFHDVDRANVQLLGTGLWQDAEILKPSSANLLGSVFAVPPRTEAFAARFQSAFGAAPHPLAVLGYDAARLLTDMARESSRTNQPIETLMLRPEGFVAEGGYIRFRADGQTSRGLSLVKVGSGQFEVIQQAPVLAPLPLPDDLLPRDGGRNWSIW